MTNKGKIFSTMEGNSEVIYLNKHNGQLSTESEKKSHLK